jgi:hypothetical protein
MGDDNPDRAKTSTSFGAVSDSLRTLGLIHISGVGENTTLACKPLAN